MAPNLKTDNRVGVVSFISLVVVSLAQLWFVAYYFQCIVPAGTLSLYHLGVAYIIFLGGFTGLMLLDLGTCSHFWSNIVTLKEHGFSPLYSWSVCIGNLLTTSLS